VSAALILGAALAIACVVLVALPFLREPEPVSDELDELTPERRQRLALAEERDREDYRASIGPLRREAAEALRALDRGEPAPAPLPDDDRVDATGKV
jgi:hypothetical protein